MGRVKAAPAMEPARRGTSSGVLASPRVAKVQACKVGIGPARRGKKAWLPLPLPGVAPIGPAAGPAPPSPGAPRPHPRRSTTPPSGQERGGPPSSMKEIPLLSLAWGLMPHPAGGGVGRMGRRLGIPFRIPVCWTAVVKVAYKSRTRSGCALWEGPCVQKRYGILSRALPGARYSSAAGRIVTPILHSFGQGDSG